MSSSDSSMTNFNGISSSDNSSDSYNPFMPNSNGISSYDNSSDFSDSMPNFGGMLAGVIVANLVIFGIIAALCVYCIKTARKTVVESRLQTVVGTWLNPNNPTPNPTPPYHAVEIWEADPPTMEKFLRELAEEKPVRFTAQQLCAFTTDYSTRLGSGGFGTVYKGQFPNGVKIAVKVLEKNKSEREAEEQFMAEVGTIGRTYHINLVRLYGFCYDQQMNALVYEFMENGSLDKYLFMEKEVLDWKKLHDIAIGTAKGIAYLHEECQQRIIHYDIKPGNILLDAKFSPKVADFGLAKLSNRDDTHVSIIGYKGTPGYIAPEFHLRNHPITYKCDVYSFGMVLFEILGRRKNTIVGSNDSINWFPKHVWERYEKSELTEMVEACAVEDEEDREKAERMAMVALWCVQDSPEARPRMSAIVKMMEGGVEIMPPPKPFHYLYSFGMSELKSSTSTSNSNLSSNEETNSHWYKETTPIMTKYEIQLARS